MTNEPENPASDPEVEAAIDAINESLGVPPTIKSLLRQYGEQDILQCILAAVVKNPDGTSSVRWSWRGTNWGVLGLLRLIQADIERDILSGSTAVPR